MCVGNMVGSYCLIGGSELEPYGQLLEIVSSKCIIRDGFHGLFS